jgi:hypothetical protein
MAGRKKIIRIVRRPKKMVLKYNIDINKKKKLPKIIIKRTVGIIRFKK